MISDCQWYTCRAYNAKKHAPVNGKKKRILKIVNGWRILSASFKFIFEEGASGVKVPSRSSRLGSFYKTGVLKNFALFTGRHLRQSTDTLLENRISGEFRKTFKNTFFNRTTFVLLLAIMKRVLLPPLLKPESRENPAVKTKWKRLKWWKNWWAVRFFSQVRSRHHRCSIKEDILKNFAKFTGKHLEFLCKKVK